MPNKTASSALEIKIVGVLISPYPDGAFAAFQTRSFHYKTPLLKGTFGPLSPSGSSVG